MKKSLMIVVNQPFSLRVILNLGIQVGLRFVRHEHHCCH